MNELNILNKYLFIDNNIETFKRYFNELNYYNEIIKLRDVTDFITEEDIKEDYKEELNIDTDLDEYIQKKMEKIKELHTKLKYYILLKEYLQNIYETNTDIYNDVVGKNDYYIKKQEDVLKNTVSMFKNTKDPDLVSNIFNLSRNIGFVNDNIVFIKGTENLGRIIDNTNSEKLKIQLLFNDDKIVIKSIKEVEPYLSLSKNKFILDKVFNNIYINSQVLDKLKLEAGIDIDLSVYDIDIETKINQFSNRQNILTGDFLQSLPDIDNITREELRDIILNIHDMTINKIKKTIKNNEQYDEIQNNDYLKKMVNIITKSNINTEDIVFVYEYPKKEDNYSPLSLYYGKDPIIIEDNDYPSLLHYFSSKGTYNEYKHLFFSDSDVGTENIKDNFKRAYYMKKIMEKKDPLKKYGIKKNNISEEEYYINCKEILLQYITDNNLEDLLKSTDDKYIVYVDKNNNPGYLYGKYINNNVYGFNLIGKYLMEIRDIINNTKIETDIELDSDIELPYYKNMSNNGYDYSNKVISNYYLLQSLEKQCGDYYIESIDSLELKEKCDNYLNKIGLFRYILNDSCDVRILENYGQFVQPFNILGRRYYSINHAILGLKYMYYNDPNLSPYYTKLLYDWGKSFSLPEGKEIYEYDHYLMNSIEILNLKPPINIDNIPEYWKKISNNDMVLGSIIHKYLLFCKFNGYEIFKSLAIILKDVCIYEEIKNTELIKNYDIMEVFNFISNGGVDCYFTNIMENLILDTDDYYAMVIDTIIINLIHQNRELIIKNITNLISIVSIDKIIEKIDVYHITRTQIVGYIGDNFMSILNNIFKSYIEKHYYEFIKYITDELNKNGDNINNSDKEYILSIIKILENDKSLTIDNIEEKLNEYGIFYILEDDHEGDHEVEIANDNIDIKLQIERDRIIDLFDGIDYENNHINNGPSINNSNHNFYWSIKEFPVVDYDTNIITILESLGNDYDKKETKINIKYDHEEPVMGKFNINKVNDLESEIINLEENENIIIANIENDKLKIDNKLNSDTCILIKYSAKLDNGLEEHRYLKLLLIEEGNGGNDDKIFKFP
tara:strand:+ start:13 stop:3213 length:3201 start_codon:yes stop_codon:yes gene_type:complete